MKTNDEVVKDFINHKQSKSKNMSSDGNRLFSYNTCIAQYTSNKEFIILNNTGYSNTTNKHQCIINNCIKQYNICAKLFFVPYNCADLILYFKNNIR